MEPFVLACSDNLGRDGQVTKYSIELFVSEFCDNQGEMGEGRDI